jgi:hypothetical protein
MYKEMNLNVTEIAALLLSGRKGTLPGHFNSLRFVREVFVNGV